MRTVTHPPRLTAVALALASALAAMVSTTAQAQVTNTVSSSSSSIYNWISDNLVVNGGVVLSGMTGIVASAFLTSGTLTNNGSITGHNSGITNNNGTIGVVNNGNFVSGNSGIENFGRIGTLNNTGTISAVENGVTNYGTLTVLVNSGVISGSTAIYNAGTIGTVVNSGLIAGNISNMSTGNLTINGGSGATFGTLTGSSRGIGAGDIGFIGSGMSGLVFGTGNLLLNDDVDVQGSYTVNNAGAVLQVNNQIHINGNYTQGAAASLKIGVADGAAATGSSSTDSGYGRLIVSGSATIAAGSGITLSKLNSYAFAQGQRYVVIVANSTGTNYNAGSLVYSATGYSGSVSGASVVEGSNTNLVVTLAAGGSSAPLNPATTATAVSSLSGLFKYGGSNASLMNLFNASAALGSTAEANRVGAQLAPARPGAAAGAAAAPTFDVMKQVAARADSVRLAQAHDGHPAGSNGQGSGVATGESASSWALWGQPYGGRANQGMVGQVDGYHATYTGLVLGADRAVSERWRAGGVLSYSNTSIDGQDNTIGSSTRVNGYGLLGYASFSGAPWYLNLTGGAVQQQFDTTRAISFTGFSGAAKGKFNGWQYVASAEAGYPLAAGEYTFTPTAALIYSYQSQDSYTESGGNGAALSVAASNSTSLRSTVGGKLERGFESAYGVIVPDVQLKWIHEYRNSPTATTATYGGDTSGLTRFTTLGAAPLRDLASFSVGVTLLRANNLSLTMRYEAQAGSHFVSQTGSLRLRMAM